MKSQLKYLDNYNGNIDTLANRISNVRTWSYVANKKGWVENADFWIEKTKSIELFWVQKLKMKMKLLLMDNILVN